MGQGEEQDGPNMSCRSKLSFLSCHFHRHGIDTEMVGHQVSVVLGSAPGLVVKSSSDV